MKIPFFARERPARCKPETLSTFTKQLSALIGSGVPLHKALEALSREDGEELHERVIPELVRQVAAGHTLSRSLLRFPGVFPPTYVALMRAAEQTGALVAVLDRLSEWLDRTVALKRRVSNALTYPVFVLILSLGLTVALFRTVVPKILDTVAGLGVEFPLPTRILAGLVAALGKPWLWVLAGLIVTLVVLYLRTPEGTYRLQAVAAVLPVVGPIVVHSSASRYAFTLSMLTATGVDFLQSLNISAEASGSLLIWEDSQRVQRTIREGGKLSEIFEDQLHYPHLLCQLVRLGEEVGRFDRFLQKACSMLEEDTGYRLERLTALVEPLILAGLSCFVGFVLISTLLPLSKLAAAL